MLRFCWFWDTKMSVFVDDTRILNKYWGLYYSSFIIITYPITKIGKYGLY